MAQLLIQAGLANQMFQYAFFLSLKEKSSKMKHCRLNITEYLIWDSHYGYELNRAFGIKEETVEYKSRIGKKLMRFIFLKEPKWIVCVDPKYVYYEEAYKTRKPFLLGYWMNVKYFEGITDKIRSAFIFQNIDEDNRRVANEMQERESVAIHVRRGDYLQLSNHFCVCDIDYYSKAIDILNDTLSSPFYYIFSDDLDWCKEHFPRLGIEFEVVDINRGTDSYKDMFLMTQCKHNIIANSTFSWWGAWLNQNPNKQVVAPIRWFADLEVNLCPSDWIRI